MAAEQKFLLSWNNHQGNLSAHFESLLRDEKFLDVTLACEGKSISAHKAVLSACSPYFDTLFANNPCKHPIVLLHGIGFQDIGTIVHFMYHGSVSVTQTQLPDFLKAATSLQIKGLALVATTDNKASSAASIASKSTENVPDTPPIPKSVAPRLNLSRLSPPAAKKRKAEPREQNESAKVDKSYAINVDSDNSKHVSRSNVKDTKNVKLKLGPKSIQKPASALAVVDSDDADAKASADRDTSMVLPDNIDLDPSPEDIKPELLDYDTVDVSDNESAFDESVSNQPDEGEEEEEEEEEDVDNSAREVANESNADPSDEDYVQLTAMQLVSVQLGQAKAKRNLDPAAGFKISSEEDLKAFNEALSDSETLKKNVITLSLVGGNTSSKVTSNILSILFNWEFATGIVMGSKPNRLSIKPYKLNLYPNIILAICNAVRRNKKCKECTDKTIIQFIRIWLSNNIKRMKQKKA